MSDSVTSWVSMRLPANATIEQPHTSHANTIFNRIFTLPPHE